MTLHPRDRLSLDAGWRFAFGSAVDPKKDFNHATGYFSYLAKSGYGDGPAAPTFDDRAWRKLDLPHDWAVEVPFANNASHSHGYRAVGGKFTDANVGWYRKKISIPADDQGRRIRVVFDGVFRDSRVWFNGFYLGQHPSGYTGFSYDITDYVHFDGDNVLSVRVDATMEEGWFYEGAGIYRHTWLEKTSPVHVAENGTFITTEVAEGTATVKIKTEILNEETQGVAVQVEQVVMDAQGKVVATSEAQTLSAVPGVVTPCSTSIQLARPALWSLEHPTLYKVVTLVQRDGGSIADRYESTFGIRTIRFDPNEGFFLNGQHVILKGTNNHQDHAGVGVALPDALQEFRIARLKEMGSNAYRCSHNPPTPELLEACDRLGMLVIDENRLIAPSPEQHDELEKLIRRDRNHPSVILWSIGNEEWAIEGNEMGARIAAPTQAVVQRLDPTRRVTAAVSGGRIKGISTVIDVMGYNYVSMGNIDEHHREFPQQPALGTEETTTQATRGVYLDDNAQAHLAPRENGTSGGNCEYGWKYYVARPFMAGLFYWTGFDYRGEPTPFSWPAVSSQFGILDTCGFPKDSFYYLKAWWTDQPVVHILPHWNWPERKGQPIEVRVFANGDEVELFLNAQSLGRKPMERNGHLSWEVPYTPGVLLARSYRAGHEIATDTVETTGPATAVRLTANRAKIAADTADLAMITVELVDAKGRVVPTANDEVSFSLEGAGKIIGVGNGDPSSHEPDRFIDNVSVLAVEDWRSRTVDEATLPKQVVTDFDDHDWPEAFATEEIKARLASTGRTIFRGHFKPGEIQNGSALRLFLGHFGEKPEVYLNGQRLDHVEAQGTVGISSAILPAQLRSGLNTVVVVASPLTGKHNPEGVAKTTSRGALQAITPASGWKRHVFNGLAQVIVQSTDRAGEITLTAGGAGLTSGSMKIFSDVPVAKY